MNSEVEAPILRSAIGGYAEKASFDADQLVDAIREDQTEFLPRGLAEEVSRTEAIEAAKKRDAEKRKREAAEMPPPDTWSIVTSRGRSRTLQSSSRLSSGEGCSSWEDGGEADAGRCTTAFSEGREREEGGQWLRV